jgi:hypothetical protein
LGFGLGFGAVVFFCGAGEMVCGVFVATAPPTRAGVASEAAAAAAAAVAATFVVFFTGVTTTFENNNQLKIQYN